MERMMFFENLLCRAVQSESNFAGPDTQCQSDDSETEWVAGAGRQPGQKKEQSKGQAHPAKRPGQIIPEYEDGFKKSGIRINRGDFARMLQISGTRTMACARRPLGKHLFIPPLNRFKDARNCKAPAPDVKTIRNSMSAVEALANVYMLNSMSPEEPVPSVLNACAKHISKLWHHRFFRPGSVAVCPGGFSYLILAAHAYSATGIRLKSEQNSFSCGSRVWLFDKSLDGLRNPATLLPQLRKFSQWIVFPAEYNVKDESMEIVVVQTAEPMSVLEYAVKGVLSSEPRISSKDLKSLCAEMNLAPSEQRDAARIVAIAKGLGMNAEKVDFKALAYNYTEAPASKVKITQGDVDAFNVSFHVFLFFVVCNLMIFAA